MGEMGLGDAENEAKTSLAVTVSAAEDNETYSSVQAGSSGTAMPWYVR